jgi:GNAT superfamily N-acetyltransferase
MSLQSARLDLPTPTRVLVRPALVSDRPAVRALMAAAYAPYAHVLGPELFARYQTDLLDLDRHARLGDLLVAEVDGVVRGSGIYYPDAAAHDLGWPRGWATGRGLAVDPAARGHGVGRAVVRSVERRAHDDDASVFALHTAGFMRHAITLYAGLGYVRAPELDLDLAELLGAKAGRPVPALAYLRRLAAPGAMM